MKTRTLLNILFLLIINLTFGQNKSIWKPLDSNRISTSKKMDVEALSATHKFFELDLESLNQALKVAPSRAKTFKSNTIISFPNISGELEEFKMLETSNFDDALQARFPEIRSYVGVGTADKSAQISISISPQGIQAQIFRVDKKTELIIPFSNDKKIYDVSLSPERGDEHSSQCATIDNFKTNDKKKGENMSKQSNTQVTKTLRLALSCTAEYTALKGGTIPLVLASINNTLTVVNGILGKEVAVKLVMINNTSLLYTDATTDPFSNPEDTMNVIAGCNSSDSDCPSTWSNELQTTLTAVVGEPNYDIGHLFATGNKGGNAGCIGCVCDDLVASKSTPVYQRGKGSGWSSFSNNLSNIYFFEIENVPHEIGHQLGANHTFGYINEKTGVNVEPGSGSTIMSYGGGAPAGLNVVTRRDDYYAYSSIDQIQTNLATKESPINTVLTNSPPAINAGADLILPKGTPFFLTGSGTDSNGDSISYCWEQNDSTRYSTNLLSIPAPTKIDGAYFRSLPPGTSPIRYFPSLKNLSFPTANLKWEVPPAWASDKTLNFTLTGRDNALGQEQNNTDAMTVTFKGDVGPFEITSQNTQDQIWIAGATETILWTVNNTTTLSGSATVDILFSTDAGLTFPTVLLANTPNDGSQTIIVPNVLAQKCKIMVKPSNNVYFNVNSEAIAIGYAVETVCKDYVINPDFSIPDGATDYSEILINVPNNEFITDVNLSLNITHPFMKDLIIKLRNPTNDIYQTMLLNNCNSHDDFNGNFDDAGSEIVCSSPIVGLIKPIHPLSDFNGSTAIGDWKLRIRDIQKTNIGVLNSATLTTCSKVYTQSALSNEQFNDNKFVIFPNPSTGLFTIQTNNPIEKATIAISDLNGRIVHQLKAENLDNKQLDLNHLQNGIYILNISNATYKYAQKLVKQ